MTAGTKLRDGRAGQQTWGSVRERARRSLGVSSDPVYRMVARCVHLRRLSGKTLLDVGCGAGNLWHWVRDRFTHYVGADVMCFPRFPRDGRFLAVDLDTQRIPLPDGSADVVAAVETIEHVENPRAFMREMVRLCRPGGWVILTTPNQLSLLSKLTLVFKNQFNAFQDGCYPAHLTALVESDLLRIATECGLTGIATDYSTHGRIPGSSRHFPRWLSRRFPRALSDNILLAAQKPSALSPITRPGQHPRTAER